MAKRKAKLPHSKGAGLHLKRFGLGILVVIQALALGVFGVVLYVAIVYRLPATVTIIVAILIIYFAGLYEEDRRRLLKAARS